MRRSYRCRPAGLGIHAGFGAIPLRLQHHRPALSINVSAPWMPRTRQTRNDVKPGLALSLLPIATLGQTRIALAFDAAPTIDAHGLECRRVFQNENNYRFGYESARVCDYHINHFASDCGINGLWDHDLNRMQACRLCYAGKGFLIFL